ncbi:MAG: hypothetical protein ACRCV7_03855 [Culicoidibacterales bacterium]
MNRNIRNLSDKEIVRQIQEKMKEEMDKLHFEVDFSDYEFQVNTGVEIQSNFGTVTLKDKRYNYDPIEIYDGNFEVIDTNKIGVNPILFVAQGYQNYKETGLINTADFKKEVQNILEILKLKNIEGKQLPFRSTIPYEGKKYAYVANINKLDKIRYIVNYSTVFGTKGRMNDEEYLEFFNQKTTRGINYETLEKKLKYEVVVTFKVNSIVEDYEIKNIQNTIENKNIIINII